MQCHADHKDHTCGTGPVCPCWEDQVNVVVFDQSRTHRGNWAGDKGNDSYHLDVNPGFTLDGISLDKQVYYGDVYVNDGAPGAGAGAGGYDFSIHWWYNPLGNSSFANYHAWATESCHP
jgi:hypothetical protein